MSAASGAGAGGEEATRTSGGTGDLLPRERARASFDVEAVAGAVFLGREDAAQRAEWGRLFDTPEFDFTYGERPIEKSAPQNPTCPPGAPWNAREGGCWRTVFFFVFPPADLTPRFVGVAPCRYAR